MNDRQSYLLKLLCEIHDICTRHDISYYLVGGTLLGAVRNEGFLPWDDDADIAMAYDDYLRFVEACKTDLPENRVLRDPAFDESYRRVIPRYMSTDTTSIHTTSSLHDDVAGELIDIFVLDPVADGEQVWRDYVQDLYLYNSVVNYASANGTRVEVDPDLYLQMRDLIDVEGRLRVNQILNDRLVSHFDAAGSSYAYRWKGYFGLFKRAWFESPKQVRFEGHTFLAPGNIDEFLRVFYGEEWFLVPTSVMATKHKLAASLAFPYTEALEFYRPTYDRQQLMADCQDRIELRLSHAKEINELLDEGVRIRARAAACEVRAVVERNRAEFDAALAAMDGKALAAILKDYLELQSSKRFVGRTFESGVYRYFKPVLVDVDDDVLDAALIAYLTTSRVGSARRLIEVARAEGRELTPKAVELEAVIDVFHACVADYEAGRFESGVAHARELVGSVPSSAEFHMLLCAQLAALCEHGGDAAAAKAREDEVALACREFPEDGYFMKQRADLLWEEGATDEATRLYGRAAEQTYNGFALHAIAERIGYHPRWLRNAPWAREAGVPQWGGEEPPSTGPSDAIAEANGLYSRAHYLLGLLGEAAKLCRQCGIECVVGPEVSRALRGECALPADPSAYVLLCKPQRFPRLLSAEVAPNRLVGYLGNDRSVRSCHVRYYGTDSLCFTLKREPADNAGLFVTLVPLEAPDRRESFSRELGRRVAARVAPSGREARRGLLAPLAFRALTCRAMRSGDPCVRLSKKSKLAAGDVFAETEQVAALGFEFTASRALDGAATPAGGKRPAYLPDAPDASHVMAVGAGSYEDFSAAGGVPAGYYGRRKASMDALAPGERTFKRFMHNFRQLQLAVRLKELSLELMPQKERIMALHRAGDYKALRKALGPYMECARKYRKYGDALFDDDLFEVLNDTMKHSG